MAETSKKSKNPASVLVRTNDERGFTLVEAIFAIVILTVVLLSAVTLFAYATRRNAGNNTRSQALAVLQQQVETIRSYKFTPTATATELSGGTKPVTTVNSPDGGIYQVAIVIDDNPNSPNVQIDSTSAFKEITVTVTGPLFGENWVSAVPATVVTRRVRAN